MVVAWVVLAGMLASSALGWLLVRFEGVHAHLSHDHTQSGPQKFHSRPTPRIGGLPIAVGLLAALAVAVANEGLNADIALGLCLSVTPAFASGLIEDLTKKIGPDIRLWASFLSALLAIQIFDATVNRSGIPPVDLLLAWYPLALIFTVIGIGGVAHAVNLIDGYNGLASMVAIMMLTALGVVAWQVDDRAITLLCAALASSTLGFLCWNFPHGRLFAGDGGAYLLGTSTAIISVLLTYRNPAISPWFPLAVLIYPVFETLFTVYRRKFKQAAAADQPDAKHLHQLIHRRLLRNFGNDRCASCAQKTLLNAATSPFLWMLALTSILPAMLFWNDSGALVVIVAGFCMIYVWFYRALVRFSVPHWLRRLARILVARIAGGQADQAA